MGIKILAPGLLTTVQDSGRTGFQKYGISPSGALDLRSLTLANLLAGNPRGEACLELTLMGPTIEFVDAAVIAITGGDLSPVLNGSPAPLYEAIQVAAGSVLSFGFAQTGCRSYLAVSGGFEIPLVMGSKSTNLRCGFGGFSGRALREGDFIPTLSRQHPPLNRAALRLSAAEMACISSPNRAIELRYVSGPQSDFFNGAATDQFEQLNYTVSPKSDRMGCRLDGQTLRTEGKTDIISDAIPLGGIQIASDGKPIVMLADRQTIGGYAKIGTVIGADLPYLAQRKPGDSLQFRAITLRQARATYLDEEKWIRKIERRFEKCFK